MTQIRPSGFRTWRRPRVPRSAAWVIALLALPGCSGRGAQESLLDRAIEAAGGKDRLQSVTELSWRGEATVYPGGQPLELGVITEVRPFESARSVTWELAKGEASTRVLEISAKEGWMTRGGAREPLPASLQHLEQMQFGLYGLMLLTPLRAPNVHLASAPDDSAGRHGLIVRYPGMPQVTLYFDAQRRLAYLTDEVPQSDGNGTSPQRLEFEGTIEDHGVRWPRLIHMSQSGRPYFELRIREFHAVGAAAASAAGRP